MTEDIVVKNFVKNRLVYDLLEDLVKYHSTIDKVDGAGNYNIQIGKKNNYRIHICKGKTDSSKPMVKEHYIVNRDNYEIIDKVEDIEFFWE